MAVAFERLSGDLLLLAIGKQDPSATEWQGWLDFVQRGRYWRPRVIVYSAGGGPDAAQRRALADIMRTYPATKVAVMVDSVFGRGIVTALGWLYGNFAAFGTGDLRGALHYLDLRLEAPDLISPRIARLRAICSPSSPPAVCNSLSP